MSGALQAAFQNQRSFTSGYWEALSYSIVSPATYDQWRYVTQDASGNTFVVGTSSRQGAILQKYAPASSTFLQQFTNLPAFFGSDCCNPYNGIATAVAFDSSNNIYLVGRALNDFALVKYNSSGTLVDKKSFPCANALGGGVSIDSSSNIIFSGDTGSDLFVHKYSSTYTLIWRRSFSNCDQPAQGQTRSVVNTSTNVTFIAGTLTSSAGCAIIAVDSAGATSWSRKLTQSGTVTGMDIKLDSTGANIYVAVRCSTLTKMVVAKYDTSGTLQWQRSLSGSPTIEDAWGLALDSSNNVYVVGQGSNGFIAKWDSSGTIQWQRNFSGLNGFNPYSVSVYGTSFYIVGTSGVRAMAFVLPTDGSKTGTFPTLNTFSTIYLASAYTEAAGGMTEAAFTTTNSTDTSKTLGDATYGSGTWTKTNAIGQIT